MEIIPKVHHIPDIIANPYLIIDSDGLTLIDTGLPGSHRKILQYIESRGHTPGDLRRIILTHSCRRAGRPEESQRRHDLCQ